MCAHYDHVRRPLLGLLDDQACCATADRFLIRRTAFDRHPRASLDASWICHQGRHGQGTLLVCLRETVSYGAYSHVHFV